MKKCPNCGNVIENDNAKFCRKCGAKLPETNLEEKSSNIESVKDHMLQENKQNLSNNDNLEKLSSINNVKDHPESSPHKSSITEPNDRNLSWAVKTCFTKYATFKGRASRKEYWYFCLFNFLVFAILYRLAYAINNESLSLFFLGVVCLYSIVVILPGLSVTIRRLHDVGKSGWFYWIVLIPYLGGLILLYFMCKKGNSGENKYGRCS